MQLITGELNPEPSEDLNIFAVALVLACHRLKRWGVISDCEAFRNELIGEAHLILGAADASEKDKFMKHFYATSSLESLG